jgi:hypothetical protein
MTPAAIELKKKDLTYMTRTTALVSVGGQG